MDRFVARRNIEHFRQQLAEAPNPAVRENLARLLAEAEEQLKRAEEAHKRAAREAG